MTRSLTYSTRSLAGLKGESMRKLIVASAFAALMASAPAMAASPGGSVGGGAAARGGIFTPGIAAPGGIFTWHRRSGRRRWCGRFDWLKFHQHTVHAHGSTRALDRIRDQQRGYRLRYRHDGLGYESGIAGHILTIKHDSTVKRAGPNALIRLNGRSAETITEPRRELYEKRR